MKHSFWGAEKDLAEWNGDFLPLEERHICWRDNTRGIYFLNNHERAHCPVCLILQSACICNFEEIVTQSLQRMELQSSQLTGLLIAELQSPPLQSLQPAELHMPQIILVPNNPTRRCIRQRNRWRRWHMKYSCQTLKHQK